MPETAFEEIWNRIVSHKGEVYRTKTDLEFTYRIDGDGFYPSRTDYRISKSDFKQAFRAVPISGPGEINRIVRGPAYVWAVLHDRRISLGEW
jgi:maltose-binding protein MalE